MTRRAARAALALVFGSALSLGLAGQARADAPPYRIRADQVSAAAFPTIRLVVSVMDQNGKPVAGLSVGDVTVAEGGKAMTPTVKLASETAPVAIAVVLDASGSMQGRPIQDAARAISELVARLGPRDQASLVVFRATPQLVQPLTADKGLVSAAALRTVAAGDTAVYDALGAAADSLKGIPAGYRTAIVLLTDGWDNASQTSAAEAVDRAARGGHPVYTVGLGADLDRDTLAQLASVTGALAFVAPSSEQLGSIYGSVAQHILTQFSISYVSPEPPAFAGEARKIVVKIVRDGQTLAESAIPYTVPITATQARPSIIATAAPAEQPVSQPVSAGGAPARPERQGDALVVAFFGALTALCLFVVAADLALRPVGKLRKRLDQFVPQPLQTLGGDPEMEARVTRPLIERIFKPWLTVIGRRVALVTPTAMLSSAAQNLERAGNPFGLGAVEFTGLRGAVGLLCGVLFAAGALVLGNSQEVVVLAVFAGLVFGIVLPGVLLGRAVKARQKEIIRVLPSSLDMIALSVEAGLAFDGAVAQVAQRRDNALSLEFRRLLVEFQMGRQRREAMRELAQRCAVPEVTRFMNAVMQADTLGAPLSKALGELAIDLRMRKRQKAEELARTAPIKMLFPMIGLIFPALFVVILGPAVSRVMSLFGSIGH